MPQRWEPSLGGQEEAQARTGMEPGLGASHKVKPDPLVLHALLDDQHPDWYDAIRTVVDRGQGRIYALELVKIIAAGDRTTRHREGYHAEERIAAARALEAFGSEVAADALVDALGDRQWWLGQYAMEALIAIGDPAVEAVLAAVESYNAIVRRRVADVLGGIGSRKATPVLIELLRDDPSDWVRMRAARALGLLRDRTAVDALKTAYKEDEEHAVRMEARTALEALHVQVR